MVADNGISCCANTTNGLANAVCTRRATICAVSCAVDTAGQRQRELIAARSRHPVVDVSLFDVGRPPRCPAHAWVSRRYSCSRCATSCSSASPTACPCVSLMREKLSMSSINTARPRCLGVAQITCWLEESAGAAADSGSAVSGS